MKTLIEGVRGEAENHKNLHRGFSLCYVILGILTFFLQALAVQAVVTVLLGCKERVRHGSERLITACILPWTPHSTSPSLSCYRRYHCLLHQVVFVFKDEVWFLIA